MAELKGHRARWPRGDASPAPWQEHCWAPALLLSSQPGPGHQGSSSSICTEDFNDSFRRGMVEPLLSSEEEEEEPAGALPAEEDDPGRDEWLCPAGSSPEVLVGGPGRGALRGRSPPVRRRVSLESLGGRISRLSRSGALGVPCGGPWPAPSTQPALGQEPPPREAPCSRGHVLATTSCGEDSAARHPWRALGISAGSSRAGARRGSPSRVSSGRSRAHPTSKTLGLNQQKPPQLRGWHEVGISLAVDEVEKEGAGSMQRRAPCLTHRTGMAVGPPGQCETGMAASSCPGVPSCPGAAAESGWQRGKHKALLSCKSQQGQRTCAGYQEGVERGRRKTSTLQEEKLELRQRLQELEHRSHSLLRQRHQALRQLHLLLRREEVETLQQLQETLQQERAGSGAWLQVHLQHLLSHPQELVVPGQAGCSPALGTTSECPCQHCSLPSHAMGQDPPPAVVSHVLHALRGLREQVQRQLGELQRAEGAQGATGQSKELKQMESMTGASPWRNHRLLEAGRDLWTSASPAPSLKQGHPQQPAQDHHVQSCTEHPQPCPSSWGSLSTLPGLQQRLHGSLGLLHHLQRCVQELQLEEAQQTECPGSTAMGTRAREKAQRQPGTRLSPSATASATASKSCRAPPWSTPRALQPGGTSPAAGAGRQEAAPTPETLGRWQQHHGAVRQG